MSWFRSWQPLLSPCLLSFSLCLSDPPVSPSPVCVVCAWAWLLSPAGSARWDASSNQPLHKAFSHSSPDEPVLDPGSSCSYSSLISLACVAPFWPAFSLCHSAPTSSSCPLSCLPACQPTFSAYVWLYHHHLSARLSSCASWPCRECSTAQPDHQRDANRVAIWHRHNNRERQTRSRHSFSTLWFIVSQ